MAIDFSNSGHPVGSARRLAALAAAIFVQLLLGFALLNGLPTGSRAIVVRALEAFAVPVPKPPPLIPLAPAARSAHRPAAAAPSPRPRAPNPTLAAAPLLTLAPSPQIAAIDVPDLGAAAAGGGGQGAGNGAGGNGAGDGGGSPAEWLRGRITPDDFPRSVFRPGASIHLTSRFVIAPDGRVESCTVEQSSGNPDLDATTCRLIVERYRFRPAHDGAGRAVREVQSRNHYWGVEPPGG